MLSSHHRCTVISGFHPGRSFRQFGLALWFGDLRVVCLEWLVDWSPVVVLWYDVRFTENYLVHIWMALVGRWRNSDMTSPLSFQNRHTVLVALYIPIRYLDDLNSETDYCKTWGFFAFVSRKEGQISGRILIAPPARPWHHCRKAIERFEVVWQGTGGRMSIEGTSAGIGLLCALSIFSDF